MNNLAEIAIPVSLTQTFTYFIPENLRPRLTPGMRVACEFGKRRLIGVVLSIHSQDPTLSDRKLKTILELVDEEPVVSQELLEFLKELSRYYFAPIGDVLQLALPALNKDLVSQLRTDGKMGSEKNSGRIKMVSHKKMIYVTPTDRIEEKPLKGMILSVISLLRATGEQSLSRLAKQFSSARSIVQKLSKLGLVETRWKEVPRDPFFDERILPDVPPTLTGAQTSVMTQIDDALLDERSTGHGFLLFGVTGSGKTEIYLRSIATCLSRGRGAIVLVPEIGLTPQFVARFRARFGDDLAILHSGLKPQDRHAMWKKCQSGEVNVVIGARSALFAPIQNLGLIIVDEEHDSSFKQEEGVRYHGRDMAILRSHRSKGVIVLGSATPSAESLALVQADKLKLLELPYRAHEKATLPIVEIVNLRRIGPGPSMNPWISLPLHRAIETTLASKDQIILFLNRRGFSPSVICNACGHLENCKLCSVSLTFHRNEGRGILICHYCDYQTKFTGICSKCNLKELQLEGLGTEKLETTIAESFPTARVARLDRDVGSGKKSEAILQKMRNGDLDILIGTQMVTKGHDLPNVTLVGIINADALFGMPDFRAMERSFQLFVQVAGRAGRHDKPGRVIIQTRNPDHPVIDFAKRHDTKAFLDYELRDRKIAGYPPFCRLALLRIDSIQENISRETAHMFSNFAKNTAEVISHQVEILGPAPAPIVRLRDRFRYRVMIRAKDRAALRRVLSQIESCCKKIDYRARMIIDVDPVHMM